MIGTHSTANVDFENIAVPANSRAPQDNIGRRLSPVNGRAALLVVLRAFTIASVIGVNSARYLVCMSARIRTGRRVRERRNLVLCLTHVKVFKH